MKKKKIFIGILIFLVASVGLALLSPDEDTEQSTPDTTPAVVSDNELTANEDEVPAGNELANPYEGRKAEIYDIVLSRIESGDYLNATITDIKLNDNLGTDTEGDYILLVYGSFDVKNSKETGNKLLRMYADDLMASVAGEGVTEVIEGAVFWEDDYNNRTVKYAYEFEDGNFIITDVMGE